MDIHLPAEKEIADLSGMWIMSYFLKKNKPKPTTNNIKYVTQSICSEKEVEMFLKNACVF